MLNIFKKRKKGFSPEKSALEILEMIPRFKNNKPKGKELKQVELLLKNYVIKESTMILLKKVVEVLSSEFSRPAED